MDRRSFLQRMAAAAAAFTAAAGGGLALTAKPPAAAALPAVPAGNRRVGISITADTSKFEKALGEAGADVVRLLRRCRVEKYESVARIDGPLEFTAVFREAPENAPLTDADEKAWRMIERGALKDVSVAAECDRIDVTSFAAIAEQKAVVTATWIVVE